MRPMKRNRRRWRNCYCLGQLRKEKKNKDIAVGKINGRTEGRHAAETRGASRHNVARVTQERGPVGWGKKDQDWEKASNTHMEFLSNKITLLCAQM